MEWSQTISYNKREKRSVNLRVTNITIYFFAEVCSVSYHSPLSFISKNFIQDFPSKEIIPSKYSKIEMQFFGNGSNYV